MRVEGINVPALHIATSITHRTMSSVAPQLLRSFLSPLFLLCSFSAVLIVRVRVCVCVCVFAPQTAFVGAEQRRTGEHNRSLNAITKSGVN